MLFTGWHLNSCYLMYSPYERAAHIRSNGDYAPDEPVMRLSIPKSSAHPSRKRTRKQHTPFITLTAYVLIIKFTSLNIPFKLHIHSTELLYRINFFNEL